MNVRRKLDMARTKLLDGLFQLFEKLAEFDSDLLRNLVADHLNIESKALNQVHIFIETLFFTYLGSSNFASMESGIEGRTLAGNPQPIPGFEMSRFADFHRIYDKILNIKEIINGYDCTKFDIELLEYFDKLMFNINGNLHMVKKMFTMMHDKDNVKSFREEYNDWGKLYFISEDTI